MRGKGEVRMPSWDSDSFQGIVDRHWVELVRFGRGWTGDQDAAEDLAQDAFVALWEYRYRWSEGDSVRAFLYRVLRNRAGKLARREEVRLRLRDEARREIDSVPRTPDEQFQERLLLRRIEEGIASLSDRRREILVLARFHDLDRSEIAAILDISPQTVSNHLTMALNDLRRFLDSATQAVGSGVQADRSPSALEADPRIGRKP